MIHYYIIDLESSGTKLAWHEVNEISVIRCSDRNQITKNIKAEHPERVNPVALQVTNRTRADLLKGDSKEIVVEQIDNFFNQDNATPEERCIVGHNIIKFDRKFLCHLWNSCGKTFPANLWLDTIPYVKEYIVKQGNKVEKYNLEEAVKIVGKVPRGPAHCAKVDTQNNYILWHELQKLGVNSLPHIKRLVEEGSDEEE